MQIKRNLFLGTRIVRVPQECQEFFVVPKKSRIGIGGLSRFFSDSSTTVVFNASKEKLEKVGRAKALYVRQWSEKNGLKPGKSYTLVSSPEPRNSERIEIEAHVLAHKRRPIDPTDIDVSGFVNQEVPKQKKKFIRPYRTIGKRR